MDSTSFPQQGTLPVSGSVRTTYVTTNVSQDFFVRCFTSNSFGQDIERLTVNEAPPPLLLRHRPVGVVEAVA